MDTELARTFIVVIATGSCVEEAQRLHVKQSTVSTRFQRLEETLTVEQARQEIGVVSGYRATLTVGARCLFPRKWTLSRSHWRRTRRIAVEAA